MAKSVITTATTLEGQALEIAGLLQLAEEAYSIANPNTPVNRVTISPNIDGNEISISFTLPADLTVVGGTITQTATPYA